jgi:long-chain-fatty-acid--CoA ligase ACSBG
MGKLFFSQVTINFQEYYGECMKFAKALIAYKINESTAINIIGFNSPEWFFTFYGSLFSRCLPVGIYTTNNVAACEYIALHSEAKVIIAENRELAEKYYGLLKTGKVDLIVIYRDNSYVIES